MHKPAKEDFVDSSPIMRMGAVDKTEVNKMKKWTIGTLGVLTMLMFLPATSQAATVKYLKLTVMKAKLWPSKADGRCWDICLGKRYKLPARGNKDYQKYFENEEFRKACTGSKSPDAFVVLKVGTTTFMTDKFNNTCTPEFKKNGTYISKEFVLKNDGKVPFTVEVRDNDGAANVRFKSDLMGSFTAGSVPAALLAGKELTLKSFGQVEELVIKGEIVTKTVSDGCDGTYKVTVKSFDVKATKSNGKAWDNKWLTGGGGRPDVSVKFSTGGTPIQTKAYKNTVSASYSKEYNNSSSAVVVKKGTVVKLTVYDDELRSKETIGETAIGDACKIFKGAAGTYTFSNFGRVNNVVIAYTKMN